MASIMDRVPFRQRRSSPNGHEELPPEPEPDTFLEMTLQEHLEELRQRLMYSSIAVILALGIGMYFANDVLQIVADAANVPEGGILTISPTEGFVTWFKVALYIAIAITMPVLVYQLLRFVAPGLTARERGVVFMSLPLVTVFFVGGMAFAFFVLVPRALDFLSGFSSSVFMWNPRAEELVSFYLRLMIGVGIGFEMPVVILVLARIGAVTVRRLTKFRKYAFLLVMAAAAIITPTPDPFNMMLVAVPLYLLYELGIVFAWLATAGRRKNEADAT
jgi:sec-independent protein translocase protein TatC